jgi:hypothetical protein
MSAEAFIDLSPTVLGPTWERGADGRYNLPTLTLGWEIAGWVSEYLLDPNSSMHDPKPWRFTNEQLRFILWWYAVDAQGRFVYRYGVLQRLKGWGKDPLLAVISLVELCGPSRFSHFDEDGNPVGKAHPAAWVQVAAVSREQTKNTMTLFPTLMSEQFKAEYQIDAGLEIIRGLGGRIRLEAVTSSYRSLEGARSTFTLLNETQHWVTGNGGIKMYETIDGNATKGGNRYLAITNAYLPGEDSVAERMRMAYVDILEGRAPDMGSLYDSIEAHPKTGLDPDSLRLAIPLIRGDAIWINPEDVIASVMKADMAPARSRRMWLNQIVADEDALFEEDDWDALLRPGQRLLPGDQIVLGFDGGLKDDSTALVAIRVADGLIQALMVEEKPTEWGVRDRDAPRWEVDRQAVDSAIHAAFERYDVVAFYSDVALWESYVAEWSALYGPRLKVRAGESNAIAWDMRSIRRATAGNELLMRTILDGKLCHGGASASKLNLALRRHVLNARRAESTYGLSFRKESKDSPKKVDAYAALVAAHSALNDYRQRGKKEPTRSGQAWFF